VHVVPLRYLPTAHVTHCVAALVHVKQLELQSLHVFGVDIYLPSMQERQLVLEVTQLTQGDTHSGHVLAEKYLVAAHVRQLVEEVTHVRHVVSHRSHVAPLRYLPDAHERHVVAEVEHVTQALVSHCWQRLELLRKYPELHVRQLMFEVQSAQLEEHVRQLPLERYFPVAHAVQLLMMILH
jgi:hypothetical protein